MPLPFLDALQPHANAALMYQDFAGGWQVLAPGRHLLMTSTLQQVKLMKRTRSSVMQAYPVQATSGHGSCPAQLPPNLLR